METSQVPPDAPARADRLTRLVRFFSPAWLFRDASRGSALERAAAFRHNRRMRAHLPRYMARWAAAGGMAFVLMASFDGTDGASAAAPSLAVLLAATFGVLFACAACALFVVGYVYLALGRPGT